jgi:hypothetical protein
MMDKKTKAIPKSWSGQCWPARGNTDTKVLFCQASEDEEYAADQRWWVDRKSMERGRLIE